jgi:hypothetical protein
MKHFLTFVLLCLCGTAAFGQLTVFSGRVIDEHNDPVPGALIKVYKHGHECQLQADAAGNFRLAQIPAGEYFADISANGQQVHGKRILIQPDPRGRLCYNFKLFAKGVVVSIMAQNRQIAGVR